MFWKHTRWAILWALFIAFLCGIPGRDIPHISFLELLSFDKFVHAGIFFWLVIFLTRGFLLQEKFATLRRNPKSWALVFAIPYGGLLEILQGTLFVERSADIYDFIANSFGCVMAALLFAFTVRTIPFLRLPAAHD